MAIDGTKNKRMITVIEKDVYAELEILAKNDNRSVANYVRNIIINHIKNNKDKE